MAVFDPSGYDMLTDYLTGKAPAPAPKQSAPKPSQEQAQKAAQADEAKLQKNPDFAIQTMVDTTLKQADVLGSLINDYGKTIQQNTKRVDNLRQMLAYVGQMTPGTSDGTVSKATLRAKMAQFKTQFGFDPMSEVGQPTMLSGDGTLTQSQMNIVSEAIRSRTETLGSQNETMQTRLKRVYESRNEWYDFASSLTESIDRSLTTIIQALAST